jgi:hypothetical protein
VAAAGAVFALESTCPLLGRQQTGQDCQGVAVPATATVLEDAVERILAAFEETVDFLAQEVQTQVHVEAIGRSVTRETQASAVPLEAEAENLQHAVVERIQDQLGAPAPGSGPAVADAAAELAEAIREMAEARIAEATSGLETLSPIRDASVPDCTTDHDVDANSTRTIIRCEERLDSSRGGATSGSVGTSSSSVSVSTSTSSR